MIKKTKLIISTLSVITIGTIVPVVAVACSGTTTNSNSNNNNNNNQTVVQANVTDLKNLKISANTDSISTALEAAKLLLPDSSNLLALKNLFDINAIESIATQNGVTATYSIFSSVDSSTINAIEDTSQDLINTLVISVKLNLGTGVDAFSQIQNVFVTNFPDTNQVLVNTYINQINSIIDTITLTGKNTILPSELNNDNILTNLINAPSLSNLPNGLSLTYMLSNADDQAGTIDISVKISLASTTPRDSKPILVSGFLTTNQVAINSYILQVQALMNDKIIVGNKSVLPSTLTPLNIASYLNNVPMPSDGLSLSFTTSNQNDTEGSINIIINVSAANATTKSTTIINVQGFLTTNQQIINNYISSINALSGDKAITGKNITTPTTITNDDSQTYLNNVPAVPSGVILLFTISKSDSTTGTIEITINATNGVATGTTNIIIVKGFLATDQKNINDYINQINSLLANTITGKNLVIPTNLTPQNIGNNLNNVPIATGLILAYNLSQANDTDGTINITISASIANSSAIPKTSNLIKISGFLNGDQNTIDTYIDQIDKLAPNTIVGENTVLPSDLDVLSIRIYLLNMPPTPVGVTRSFAISSPNNANGTVNIIVTASITGSNNKSSKIISVNGFSTSQQWLDNSISDFTTSYVSTNQSSVSSTSVYNILNAKANSLTIADFSTYFDIASINKFLLHTNLTINSIQLIAPDTINIKNGTLNFILNLYFGKIIKPVIVTLTEFQATTISANQNTNLTKLKDIETELNKLSIKVNDKESSLSAKDAYDEIASLRNLTLEKLNSHFSISTIDTLLTTDGASNTVSLINYNQINGTITFEISLSLGSGIDKVELNNILFSVLGFHVEINLKGVVAQNSIFANYWSDPTINKTLGNNASEASLYFPNKSGVNQFDSSAVIAQSGDGTLPSYITNINFPSNFFQSNIESWIVTGHNPTGIAIYIITLKNNQTAILTVTGFMNDKRITNLKLITIEKSPNISELSPPTNNSGISITNIIPGIKNINLGTLDLNIFGGSIASYAIANSNQTEGSITLLITFQNGVILALPIIGYLKIT